jgi:hypothetical protein
VKVGLSISWTACIASRLPGVGQQFHRAAIEARVHAEPSNLISCSH